MKSEKEPEILKEYFDHSLKIMTGDITRIKAQGIVNAANSGLLGGGGVDGAIHAAGGPAILSACRELRRTAYPEGLPPGQAALTTAGNLPAAWVIHTVGPVWQGGDQGEEETLKAAYANCLRLAGQKELESLSFPAVSTGVYGFPKDRAARIVLEIMKDHFSSGGLPHQIMLVYFTRRDAEVLLAAAGELGLS
ncbi:MAG: O-acetyl-ADP-ribose deacetylase [Spirochaetales bacterium]|jgi:O-acetyl-ADP-ribose deacetylase (regulator of RNase III)|nr:O-acetyl-ADP-ribose deacetylase [Spirochaetales bacterium]